MGRDRLIPEQQTVKLLSRLFCFTFHVHKELMTYTLHHGDCLETLRTMPDNSVDSIVTDPPYGLSFMGRKWDYDVPSVEIWAECLRVLKPGGHLLAFAGTRTQHRMAVRIEDAGFEIRDMIAWTYGSGLPKSMDVSKAIDKAAGAERTERLAPKPGHENFVGRDNVKSLRESGSLSGDGGFSRPWMNDPQKVENAHWNFAPATEAARQWQGWGTALKPALEPITVARKPLVGTVAENVLQHGTGALNIDGCRVGAPFVSSGGTAGFSTDKGWNQNSMGAHDPKEVSGRWPANLCHDGSEEVLAGFPAKAGAAAPVKGSEGSNPAKNTYGEYGRVPGAFHGDTGSAARFFYCAKASKRDRGEGNTHPTVKPTDLMRYLCRLVTPPGGTVLDPFMGSGSTGKAARLEGFRFIGCELSAEYLKIAQARIEAATKPSQPDLSDI